MLELGSYNSILEQAQKGEELAITRLTSQFSPVIRSISKSYFIYGGDNEDLYQIGLIGFYDAIKKFDVSKNVNFDKFAKICVHSRIIDAIKEANRKKHSPLNTAVGIDGINIVSHTDPEDRVILREQLLSVYAEINVKLSDYEKVVLNMYIDGMSYSEISKRIGKSVKSVSNAISRIRSKLV